MSSLLYGAHVHANGIRQHYLRYGGYGRPLLLIPGITSPAITWGFVAERLAEHLDVYTLDVRGRGLSESGNHLDYDLDAYARDAEDFIAALALENCVVLGHSMGARIAVRLARTAPSSLGRAILVDPPVSGPGRRRYPAKLDWYVDSIRLSLRGMGVDEMREFCPTWSEEQLRLRAEWLHTCNEIAVRETFERFHTEDMHSDLPLVSCPALLVAATRGDVIKPEDEAEILALCPGLSAVRVPEAGHMIPWDNLEGFLEAVVPFATSGCGSA